MSAQDFETYWGSLTDEVAGLSKSTPQIRELSIRSTEFAQAFEVILQSTDGFEVFGYYSVPREEGPFAGLFMAPGYGSVVHVPPHERRRKYAVFALCARGQRLSDQRYAAAFPGLLTDRVTEPVAYPFRGIVADCLRAMDFLSSRTEVDAHRIGVASGANAGDLAFISAALRPQSKALLVNTPLLFRNAWDRLPSTADYPLEEFNDYLRSYPDDRDAVSATLSLFEPLAFANRLCAAAFLSCAKVDEGYVRPLAASLGDRCRLAIKTGRGYTDHVVEERWLARTLST